MMESQLSKLSYRVLLTGSNHEVLWLLCLEDEPHTLYIVLCITPVAQRIQVAEIEFLLLTLFDAGCSKSDLTCYKSLATALTLMIEEDTRTAEHIVSLTILLDNPETVLLGYSVWGIWVEWCILVLRNLLYLAIKLGCGSLIHTAGLLQTALADSLQDTEYTCSIYVGCKLRRIETYLNVALGCQVINFGWFHLVHHLNDTHRVAQVGIMKVEIRFTFQMSDTLAVVSRRTANRAMHIVTFL